jgi:hypothetical protein
MTSRHAYSRPRRTGGLTAYFTAAGGVAANRVDQAWDNVTLVAKKLSVLTKYENELSEDADHYRGRPRRTRSRTPSQRRKTTAASTATAHRPTAASSASAEDPQPLGDACRTSRACRSRAATPGPRSSSATCSASSASSRSFARQAGNVKWYCSSRVLERHAASRTRRRRCRRTPNSKASLKPVFLEVPSRS